MKTFTKTEEGKQVLETLELIISTSGMEVYKCSHCDELFAGRPEEMKTTICGICEPIIRYEERDSHGLENAED